MAATGEEEFARNFLCLISDGDAAPPEQGPGQQQREEIEEEVEVELGLSLGGLFPIERKGDKLPRSSSATAVQTPPMEVPATPAVPRASGSPSSASSEGDGQRLHDSVLTPLVEVPAPAPLALPRASSLAVQAEEQAAWLPLPASGSPSSASLKRDGQRLLQGTVMRTSSVPAVIGAAGKIECNKRKETQSLKRLEINNKMIERRNSTPSTSKEAAKDPAKRRRGRPPKYQATTLTSQGTTVTEESSSSSVPSSSKAARRVTAARRPLPPSSLAPRTAVATLGSSRDQGILGGSGTAAAARANSTGDDVGRRLMQEMPGVHTRDLPNGNRVDGFLYKFRQAEDVKIICLCHGSFFTPSEFVEHAGAGKVDNPMRHISVSPTQTP